MKIIKSSSIIMFGALALMTLSSCMENPTTAKNGNLVVWTNYKKNIGVLVKIMYTNKPVTRISKTITAYTPDCRNKDCIKYELPPEKYHVITSLGTDAYVTIEPGECYVLQID